MQRGRRRKVETIKTPVLRLERESERPKGNWDRSFMDLFMINAQADHPSAKPTIK
jgi:hypothetical protein